MKYEQAVVRINPDTFNMELIVTLSFSSEYLELMSAHYSTMTDEDTKKVVIDRLGSDMYDVLQHVKKVGG